MDSLSAFRKDLLDSIGKLRSQYRLNILEGDFSAMRESFGAASLQELAVRARQFLGEEKDLGIGLNNTLKSLPKLR